MEDDLNTADAVSAIFELSKFINTNVKMCIRDRCGSHFEIARGVEVGHIFKLGTKYSEAMGCNFIDKDGKSKPCLLYTSRCV